MPIYNTRVLKRMIYIKKKEKEALSTFDSINVIF